MRRLEPGRDVGELVTAVVALAVVFFVSALPASATATAAVGSCARRDINSAGAGIPTGWAVIAGASGSPARFILRLDAAIDGAVCAQKGQIGAALVRGAGIVATNAGANAWRLRTVAVVDGDVVTGGGTVRSRPRRSDLPGVGTNFRAGGLLISKDDGSGVYDTTGEDPLVADCAGARVTVVTPRPGEVAVLDLRRLTLGRRGTLVLSGAGSSDGARVVVTGAAFGGDQP